MAQTPPPPAAPTPLAPAAVTTPMAAAVARAQAAATAAATRSAAFEDRLPAPLRREGLLDLRLWQWLALPIVLVIALVLAAISTLLARRLLRPAASPHRHRDRRRSPTPRARAGPARVHRPVLRGVAAGAGPPRAGPSLPARPAQGPGSDRAVLGRAAADRSLQPPVRPTLRARRTAPPRRAGADRPESRQGLPLRDRGGGAAAERRPRRDRPPRRAGRGRHRGRAGGAEDDRERLRRHQRDRRSAGGRGRPLPLPCRRHHRRDRGASACARRGSARPSAP